MIYSFNGTVLPYVATAAAALANRVTGADTPARPGGYAGQQRPAARKVALSGTLTGLATYDALLDAWSNLCAAQNTTTPAKLYLRTGWYLWALCESFTDGERGVDHIKWDGSYKASDPFYYSDTVVAPVLGSTGGTFVVGGNQSAMPLLQITCAPASGGGGNVTITNTATGETCVLLPTASTTYYLDSRQETVSTGGFGAVDATGNFAGPFISLAVGANTITVTPGGGATVSAVALSYSPRSL